ncbi:MAG: ABC transporter substrate-binding protein [Gammaproteobacteria bacterium]|nr:ABC transporter substrate-binding protein [Gammaproteobacteria bacterium]
MKIKYENKAISFLFILVLSLTTLSCNKNQESDKQNTQSGVTKSATESGSTINSTADLTKTFNWKMVTTWPPNFPVFQEGVDRFVNDVKIMSGGRLNIKVYAGGELVPPLQTFDAVSQGTVELGHGAAYYWAGKIPAGVFFASVPFGLNAQSMTSWLYGAGGLELWRELYKEYGLVPYPMGNTGVQMGGWFNKKIDSLADIKGLKMRIPGLGGKVLAKAGGVPVLLAGGEIYTALERGTIDATEWVGPFHDERLGLNRAAKYYYYPGWHEPGTELEMIMNQNAYDQLPEDLQKIVENAARANSMWMSAQFEALNIKALDMLQDKNITMLKFPDDVIRELRKLSEQVYEEQAAKDPKFKKIYDAFNDYRVKALEWSKLSEIAYQEALMLPNTSVEP